MSTNPWSSIYSLQALCDRGQTPKRIAWAVWGMTDLFRVDAIDLSHFSVAKLKDYRNSYIEVMCLKQELQSFFIKKWLPTLGLPLEHVAKLVEVFANFATFRQHVAGYPGESTADTTWMVNWPESSVAAAEIIEEMVFNKNKNKNKNNNNNNNNKHKNNNNKKNKKQSRRWSSPRTGTAASGIPQNQN